MSDPHSSSSVDLEAVKKKLRRVDVLSGGTSPAWQAEFKKVCEDIAINEVADLLAEVERLQAQLAAQTAVVEAARKVNRYSLRSHDDLDRALVALDAADVPARTEGGFCRCHDVPIGYCPERQNIGWRDEPATSPPPDAADVPAPMAHTTSVSSGGVECCQTCFAADVPAARIGDHE